MCYFFLCIYKADEVLKFDYFAFCSNMAPTVDLSKAAQRADYDLRREKAGVTWLSDEAFTEYTAHWEALRSTHKQPKKQGGARTGAGRPKDDVDVASAAPLCT